MGSGETSVGREGIASEGLTAMGEATSEGKENGKAVELKVGKGQAVRFPESGRGALGVLEKVGVVPLNPEGGGGGIKAGKWVDDATEGRSFLPLGCRL